MSAEVIMGMERERDCAGRGSDTPARAGCSGGRGGRESKAGWGTSAAASVLLLMVVLAGGMGCAVTAEKEIRKPIRARYAVSESEFRNAMTHLLGPPLLEGNNVVALLNGDEIFPAMVEAIRRAERTVTIEQYIWSPGEASAQIVDALLERARAGVKVHIIVDAVGSLKLGARDIDPLVEAGAQIVRFNPPRGFRLFKVHHRTHRKIMVVDGKVGFTGGVCIADEWLGNAENRKVWREIHFRLEGPVVAQMQAVFMDNWLEARSELLHGPEYFAEAKAAGPMTAQFFKSGPTDAAESARLVYLLSIAAARKNIRLAHAYFVPSDTALETLLDARERGVKIEIIVPAKADVPIVAQASRSRWGKLLEAGVEFYEYEPALYHPKIMIVDDVWVTTGSVNFDERSFGMNDEANLNVYDGTFAGTLTRIFEEDKSKSRRLTAESLRRRPWLVRCWEGFVGLFRSQL